MDAFGIFEGGGAKGLAHVGALRKAEDLGIKFIGVAGTSAGAIIASLIAAGYDTEKLFNPSNDGEPGKLDVDYIDLFFDKEKWDTGKALIDDLTSRFSKTSPMKIWVGIPRFYFQYKRLINKITEKRGFFNLEKFKHWLDDLLCEGVFGEEKCTNRRVCFKDIQTPLKIIASDVVNESIYIFSREKTLETLVSEAVCASICIPIFFVPQRLNDRKLVDGGLVSNFPAWVFDDERKKHGPLVPTIGFKLIEKECAFGESSSGTGPYAEFKVFLGKLLSTVLSGDDQLNIRNIENLYIIPIKVKTRTFDFNLDRQKRHELYQNGSDAAEVFFELKWGSKNPVTMKNHLEVLSNIMKSAIGKKILKMSIRLSGCIIPTIWMMMRMICWS
jgi:NTE family protein